jgi:hypothetical protein
VSYSGTTVKLDGKVLLKRLTIQIKEVKTDYNRQSRVPMYRVEGEWSLSPAFAVAGSSVSAMYNPQHVEINVVVSQEMHELLVAELTREHNLDEVYKLEIRTITVVLETHTSYRYDRQETFPIVIDGFGYHSKVSQDPGEFTTRNDAGPVSCAILRDILMQHLRVDIGEYPRKDR